MNDDIQLPECSKILLATDGSDSGMPATMHAIYLAKTTGAELVAAFVVNTVEVFRLGIYADAALDEMREEGRQAVARVVDLARRAGVERIRTIIVEGRPGDAIVQVAEEQGVDVIVVGSHGRSAIERMLLGTVSEFVVRHAKCPVSVVRSLHAHKKADE